ncbi:MAG: CesT family type III secretion system chaperone [Rhabdochlamydiaceae bacterium]
MNTFDDLLKEWGTLLNKSLYQDQNGACKLLISKDFYAQIEYKAEEKKLLMCFFIGSISPGTFRDRLFKEALKTNHKEPDSGVLSYSHQLDLFCLNAEYDASDFKVEDFNHFFMTLTQKGKKWKNYLLEGFLPDLEDNKKNSPPLSYVKP